MLKKTISYEDFDGNQQTTTLHFHIKKIVLMENMDIVDDFEAVQADLEAAKERGEEDMTPAQIRAMLKVIKKLMRLAYGVRTDDGANFRQSDKLWDDFESSAVYEAVIFQLFDNENEAEVFMSGILPKALVEEARKAEAERNRKAPQDHRPKLETVKAPTLETEEFDDDKVLDEEPSQEETIESLRAKIAEMEAKENVTE